MPGGQELVMMDWNSKFLKRNFFANRIQLYLFQTGNTGLPLFASSH